MSGFTLHQQLSADCHLLGRFALCHLLLQRNASLPWFILVPECAAGELFALSEELRDQAMAEAARLASFIKAHFACARINFAAIGNLVPQLHLHVVGRNPDDPCWPAPVWGKVLPERTYSAQELRRITDGLRRRCELVGAAGVD